MLRYTSLYLYIILFIRKLGLFISGPLAHFLYEIMNKVFAGKSGSKVKIGQLLFSNLLISPIMNSGKSTGFYGGHKANEHKFI